VTRDIGTAVASRTGPVLVFLAGSNGAGKSTFYRDYLQPLKLPFLNADELALRLHEEALPAEAGPVDRLAFEQTEALRRSMLDGRLAFCTETVFSDPQGAKLDFLRQARLSGYTVFLVFIGLSDPGLSIARVMQRVEMGGHDVPDDKLLGRFPRTLQNLRSAIPARRRGVPLRQQLGSRAFSSRRGLYGGTSRPPSGSAANLGRGTPWSLRRPGGKLQGKLEASPPPTPIDPLYPPPSRLRTSPGRPWRGRSSRRTGGARS